MATQICLLRGINVGGKNKIKMAELRESLEAAGVENVETYIQSGNILATWDKSPAALEKLVQATIKSDFGLEVPALVRPHSFFKRIWKSNPYDQEDIKSLHVTLLSKAPSVAAVKRLPEKDFGDDQFVIKKDVVYIYLPNGAHKTKLNITHFEKHLDVQATSRNWKTTLKLVELGSKR